MYYTDVLVNVNSMCITHCPISLIYSWFFSKLGGKKTCNWCGAGIQTFLFFKESFQ